jgi:hypothetical protein
MEQNQTEYAKGYSDAVDNFIDLIKTELLWKTQDEGFIGALHWMLGELNDYKNK